MNAELLNLIIAVLVTLIYLVLSMKTVSSYLERISKPMSSALGILNCCIILGFGITLHNFSEIASGAFHMYFLQGKLMSGLFYWVVFALIAYLFSYLVFRLSFFLVDQSTAENEKAELVKNNYQLAILHGIIFIIICFVVSVPLSDVANTFVSYPKYPD
jgi:hypothetical protein